MFFFFIHLIRAVQYYSYCDVRGCNAHITRSHSVFVMGLSRLEVIHRSVALNSGFEIEMQSELLVTGF